jgi:beta-glucosidase
MTLAEKIGQMMEVDQQFLVDESDIATYALGAVHSGGGSNPERNDLAGWTEMVERYQAQSAKTRLRIPIFYGIDAVHGHGNAVGTTLFPHNIALGATRDAALVEEVARVTALEVRAAGINWNLAPMVAVAQDPRWGRTYESFSEDPKLVGELGAAAIRGAQGASLGAAPHVLACAKHFVGDGGTSFGTGLPRYGTPEKRYPFDRGDTRVDEATLRRVHVAPFVDAIAAGVGSIMPSFSQWNGEPCTGSRRLLTEMLKGELAFSGFLIADYNAIDDLPGRTYAEQIQQSVNAGMDMFMVPQRYREFVAALTGLVQSGGVPMARIDDAVVRILRVKLAMGMLEKNAALGVDRTLHESFGGAAHRALARRAVAESLVVLKNENGLLPLGKDLKRLHVAGRGADDLGRQCGGWTNTWQGRSGTPTQGTTILAAIEQAVTPKTVVSYARDGSGAAGADAAVVVIGEAPYAEFLGDRTELSLEPEDAETVARVKAAGVPTVVVLLSGRPLVLGETLGHADAFVAAWLPGTEGNGVADGLFGDRPPTGRLPFSWPRSNEQLGLHAGDAGFDPLFPFGFGLRYPVVDDPAPGGVFSGYYKILARESGRALAVKSASSEDGALVHIWDYTSEAPYDDEWEIVPAARGYRLVNRGSGKALALEGDSAADGAKVVQRAQAASAEWSLRRVGAYFRIVNEVSGKALNVAGFGTANGTPVIQWTYDGARNSQFAIVRVNGPSAAR